MSHDHSHEHHHSHNSNEKLVLISLIVTFSYMLVEFFGGIISGSLALVADAGHMLTDVGALALSWAAFYFGRKEASKNKTFGYYRFEVIAALFNAITLLALIMWIAYEAYQRITHPVEIMALPMFIVAIIGLLVNCVVFYILTKGDKEHLNIKGAILHVLGDLFGSVAAIFSAVIIYFTGWMPVDSILSVAVCLLILRSTWYLLKDSLNILMEGAPKGIDVAKVKSALLKKVSGLEAVEHIHIWAITSGKNMATLNILIKNEKNSSEIIKNIKDVLEEDFAINHTTIEVGKSDCCMN